ncbi:MAG: hypothetical protein WD845_06375 [Pirellulales bacterium]
MSKCLGGLVALLLLLPLAAMAQDYKVEAFEGAPPDGLAADVAAAIGASGFKVLDADDKIVCEIWLAKEWQVVDGFTPSSTVLYPFQPGTLVGALRFPRKSADFRNQDIKRGVYTLRYANQPVDGNHVGTFDTRDFFVMLPATDDASPEALADDSLFPSSAESAGSSHPAIMPLLKVASDGEVPSMRHLEEPDWWTARFPGKTAAGKELVVELIVVGKSLE